MTETAPRSKLQWLMTEFGVTSVIETGRDAWLIITARSCRLFAFGATSVFIALFFSSLGFSDIQIGLFMTLTLVGDVLLTLLLTLLADRLGRRRILLLGSITMIISGTTFVLSENFWVMLVAAVLGIISPSGGDFGPFRAIEESILSGLTGVESLSNVLSWYVTCGAVGSALGTEISGRIVQLLVSLNGGDQIMAYRTIFGLYIVMGLVNMVCVLMLSDRTEIEGERGRTESSREDIEQEVLLDPLGGDNGDEEEGRVTPPLVDKPTPKTGGKNPLSLKTRQVMYKLWALLALDTLADGMVNNSLTAYYFDRKFHIRASTLGDITSISYFLAAISTIFAAPLANHLGLINTMVFTHIPSSAAVLFFPLPKTLWMTIVLFFIRVGLNNMDQAPRAAFIAAVVLPEERTAVNGITSTLRTLSSTVGPTLTGWMADNDRFWIAFVAAGSLRLGYDFGLWALFVNMDIGK